MRTIAKTGNRGFTLAELLIAVAIIGILIAVAIPIFRSSLDNAEKTVKNANTRVARGMAVNEILMNPEEYHLEDVKNGTATGWVILAVFTETGGVDEFRIEEAVAGEWETNYGFADEDGDGVIWYEDLLILLLTPVEITSAVTP